MNILIEFLKKTDIIESEDSLNIFKKELEKTLKTTEEKTLSKIFSESSTKRILENLLTHYLGKTVTGKRNVFSTYDCFVILEISDKNLNIFCKYLQYTKDTYFTKLFINDRCYEQEYLFLKSEYLPPRILDLASLDYSITRYKFLHQEHADMFRKHYKETLVDPLLKKILALT